MLLFLLFFLWPVGLASCGYEGRNRLWFEEEFLSSGLDESCWLPSMMLRNSGLCSFSILNMRKLLHKKFCYFNIIWINFIDRRSRSLNFNS